MPEIRPSKLISYSSEDKAYPASNLLKNSSFAKWRSEKGGVKQEVVELGFEQPVEVCRLDIGNNGAAFIEVLVRRSASTDTPIVFLPSSSFLSPVEAKNENNLTRVRVFSGDQLQSTASGQKWDIFRFVCTQPFNKTLQYGISFVSFHAPAVKGDETTPSGGLTLFDAENENGEAPELQPGALFRASRVTKNEHTVEVTTAKPISVAAKLLLARQSTSVTNPSPTSCIQTTDHPKSSPQRKSPFSKSTEPLLATATGNGFAEATPSTSRSRLNNAPGTPSTSFSQSAARTIGRNASLPSSTSRPLAGVVFTLSGYQNPLRSELRKKALDLGASFRQYWTSDCTHLICAFVNTPKFKEVKGKGIIVSDEWIQQCYVTKSKVNWRPFRLGRAPSPPGLIEDGPASNPGIDYDDSESSQSSPRRSGHRSLKRRTKGDVDWQPGSASSNEEEYSVDDNVFTDELPFSEVDDESEDYDESGVKTKKRKRLGRKRIASKKRQMVSDKNKPTESASVISERLVNLNPEDEDTDDEMQRLLTPSTREDTNNRDSVETISSATHVAPHLPNIFEGKHFFVHSKAIPTEEERLITRLIVAFDGNLHTYMHPDVQYVVTGSKWDKELDEALAANPSIVFVRPGWIFACDEQGKWVPFQKYLVIG